MIPDMAESAAEMMAAAGAKNIRPWMVMDRAPGWGIHEMGVARMGKDPKTAQSIHCCYLSVRRTIIRWPNGKPVRTSIVRPNLGRWPPH